MTPIQQKAQKVFYGVHGTYRLLFAIYASVTVVYRVDVVGLNPFELVLVGAVLELAAFSAEIPTGVVADTYSRKLSLIIGYIVIGVGFIIEGLVPELWAVLLAQVVWGIGATFLSGADVAWLTDEIGEENLTNTMLRVHQIVALVGIVGILIGMVVGSINLSYAFVIAGIGLIVLGLVLIPLMPETGFTPLAPEERDSWKRLTFTFREGFSAVRASRVLQLVLGIEIFIGLAEEGIARLSEPMLLEEFTFPEFAGWQPVVWLGLINIIIHLLSVGGTEWVRRRIDQSNSSAILANFRRYFALGSFCILAYAFAPILPLAVTMLIGHSFFSRLAFPLYDSWVPQQVESGVRATVMSMWNQLNALGQIIGGPLIGIIATYTSIRWGLATTFLLLIPIPIIATMILRKVDA